MKTNIMLVTNNASLVQNINSELNRSDIDIYITGNSENAIEKFQQGLDMVFLLDDIAAEEKRKLNKIFSLLDDNISLVEIAEGENISDTISKSLSQNRHATYSFIDDALSNAKFNIRIEE